MQSISRRTFLKAAGGVAASGGLLLSGCGEAPAFNKGVKKQLTFWTYSTRRLKWQQKAWQLYKKQKKPDFDLKFVVFPTQQVTDKILITSQAGSGGPDIADINLNDFGRFIKGDIIFEDMTPKLQEMGILDQFFRPSATDPWSWQGKVYGLGIELDVCALSYRQDIWEKAGVNLPIETWDQFAEEAKRFHQDTGNYLLDFPATTWNSWWIQSLQQNGGYFGPDGQPVINSQANLAALQFQQRGLTEDWAIARPGTATQPTPYYAAINQGAITSQITAPWDFGGYIPQYCPDTAGKWNVQPLPAWTPGGSRTATSGGTGVSVLKTSSGVDEAIDYVIFAHTNLEALLFDFKSRQTWTTYKPALQNPAYSQPIPFFGNQRVGDVIREVAPEVNKWYTSPFWPETIDAFSRMALVPALLQKVDPEKALNAAQHETQNIINFETA
jgi:arabinosaccharide transport system substrate-binding protein